MSVSGTVVLLSIYAAALVSLVTAGGFAVRGLRRFFRMIREGFDAVRALVTVMETVRDLTAQLAELTAQFLHWKRDVQADIDLLKGGQTMLERAVVEHTAHMHPPSPLDAHRRVTDQESST